MALLSDLQTRFMNRVGFTAVTTVEQAQIREAINAGWARAASEGLSGLTTQYFVGATEGSSTLTISAHTAGSSTVTFSAVPADTRPGDVVAFSDERRIVYSVSTNDIDFGSPIFTGQTGTATLIQRTVQLPSDGRIVDMIDLTNSRKLEASSSRLHKDGLITFSAPTSYEQAYDGSVSYAVIWPVVETATKFAVKQFKVFGTMAASTDLDLPEVVLDRVIEYAIQVWRAWRTGGVSPIEAQLGQTALADTKDAQHIGSSRQAKVRKMRP